MKENNDKSDRASFVGGNLYLSAVCVVIGWMMVCILTGMIPLSPESETDFQSKLPFIHVVSYSALAMVGCILAREQLRNYNDAHDMNEHAYSIASWTITISECISMFFLILGIASTRGKSPEDSLILSVAFVCLLVTLCVGVVLLEKRRQSKEASPTNPASVCEEHTEPVLTEPPTVPLQEKPARYPIRFTLKGFKIRLSLELLSLSAVLIIVLALHNVTGVFEDTESMLVGVIALLLLVSIVAKMAELLDISNLSENRKIDLGIVGCLGVSATCAVGILFHSISLVPFVMYCGLYSVYALLTFKIVRKVLTECRKKEMKETTD